MAKHIRLVGLQYDGGRIFIDYGKPCPCGRFCWCRSAEQKAYAEKAGENACIIVVGHVLVQHACRGINAPFWCG